MANYSILILEDEDAILVRYKEYAQDFFSPVYTARNCSQARSFIVKEQIDCVLADIRLPDGSGIEIIKELQIREREIPAIIITGHADKDLAIEAVNTGVFHFLEKPVSKARIKEIMAKCAELLNQKFATHNIASSYTMGPNAKLSLEQSYGVSEREMEVVQLAIQLHKNNIIAEKLFISEGTVKRHLHNVFDKLKISSKEELQQFVSKLNTTE